MIKVNTDYCRLRYPCYIEGISNVYYRDFVLIIMRGTYQLLLFFTITSLSFKGTAQLFMNGDMNGIVDFVSIPTNWTFIPETDPVCQASTLQEATVDILDVTGPSLSGGVAGVPYSGGTFCSGLHAGSGGSYLWHEGIMQTVNGFTIGNSYDIGFYQAVVKQTNCIDEWGSWRVYLDGNLIATSIVSNSVLPPDDINLLWDYRTVNFTATATAHTLKFIPWDDDANIEVSETDVTGALRMGIDSIHFVTIQPEPPVVDLGNDTVLCVGDSLVLDVANQGATYVWQDNSTNSMYTVYQSGVYWVEVTNAFSTVTDSIYINFESTPAVNLGEYGVVCNNTNILLNAVNSNASYVWQDNSTDSAFEVSQPGIYFVVVTNMCGSDSDSVSISYEDCSLAFEMPNIFTPNADGANDVFIPVVAKSIEEASIVILNRWGETVFESKDVMPGWNGTSNGTDCKEGTYFWLVNYSDLLGNSYEVHGWVQLAR